MLDWRGLVGTLAVHGVAVAGWPALDLWPTTMCMCGGWNFDEPMAIYDVPTVRQVQLFTYVDPPTGVVAVPYTQRKTCSSSPDIAPVLLWYPEIPPRLRGAGSIDFCASVRTDGTVSDLVLLRSGDRPRQDVAAVHRLMRQARFRPGPQPTLIEISLTS